MTRQPNETMAFVEAGDALVDCMQYQLSERACKLAHTAGWL